MKSVFEQKNECIFRYKSMESVKSSEIDKRNECVFDLYFCKSELSELFLNQLSILIQTLFSKN